MSGGDDGQVENAAVACGRLACLSRNLLSAVAYHCTRHHARCQVPPGEITASLPTSLSTGQLMTARNTGYPQDTIAEEDGVLPEDEDKEQKKKEETETETEVVEDGGGSSAARAGNPEVAEAKVEANGAGSWDKPILRHRRESMSRRVDVMNIQVDAGMLEPAGGEGEEVAAGQVSPSSEVKRGSISPGRADGNRCVYVVGLWRQVWVGGWVGGWVSG